jgi:crossover junction endodeoxyribonuclease RuvC
VISVLAIDPGLTGALAAYDGNVLLVKDLPVTTLKKKTRLDLGALMSLVRINAFHLDAHDLLVEQVGTMPRQGLSSAFNFGFTNGAIHMAAHANAMNLHTVTPTTWKFGVGLNAVLGQDQKARKDASRAKAIELFPQYADIFSRVKDDGRAEAALMAWWFVHKKSNLISLRSDIYE